MEKKKLMQVSTREGNTTGKCGQLLLPSQPAVKIAKNAIQLRWTRSWSGPLQTSQATCHPTLHLLPSVLLMSLPRGQALTCSFPSHKLFRVIKADLGMGRERQRERIRAREAHNVC